MNDMRKLIDLGSKLFESSIEEVADPIAHLRHTEDDPPDDLTDAYKNFETIIHISTVADLIKKDLDEARKDPESYIWSSIDQKFSMLAEIIEYMEHQARQQIEQARSK